MRNNANRTPDNCGNALIPIRTHFVKNGKNAGGLIRTSGGRNRGRSKLPWSRIQTLVPYSSPNVVVKFFNKIMLVIDCLITLSWLCKLRSFWSQRNTSFGKLFTPLRLQRWQRTFMLYSQTDVTRFRALQELEKSLVEAMKKWKKRARGRGGWLD